jgi:O-antigen/teichoic acid export membrane protein
MKRISFTHVTIKNILAYLRKSGFLKAAAKLSGATAIGQIISLLASLILTRLYIPDDFGTLGIFNAIIGQLTVIISLRYEWAILTPKEDEKAVNVVFISSFLTIIVTTIITLLITIMSPMTVATWLKVPSMAKYIWLVPIASFSGGMYQIFNYWALRQKNFSLISKTQISKSLWSNSIQIGMGFFKLGALGLLIGSVLNQFVGIFPLISLFIKTFDKYTANYSISDSITVFKEYLRFALSCVASSFFNYAAISAPVVLIAFYYDTQAVGLFALAQRLTSLPAIFIGSAISQVYFTHACELVHKDPVELKRLHIRTSLLLLAVSLAMDVCLLAAPWFVPLIFGNQWQGTGLMALYMTPMLLFTISVSPLSMLEWLGKNTEVLVWHVVRLALIGLGFYYSNVYHLSAPEAVGVFSIVNGLMYAVLFLLNKQAIDDLILKKNNAVHNL